MNEHSSKFGSYCFDLIDLLCLMPLSAIFQLYHGDHFYCGGKSRRTRKEPPTMGKQLLNFTTDGCESSAPF